MLSSIFFNKKLFIKYDENVPLHLCRTERFFVGDAIFILDEDTRDSDFAIDDSDNDVEVNICKGNRKDTKNYRHLHAKLRYSSILKALIR